MAVKETPPKKKKKNNNKTTNKHPPRSKHQTKCYTLMTLTNFSKTQNACFSICIIQVKGLERSNRQGIFRKFFFCQRYKPEYSSQETSGPWKRSQTY